MECRIICMLSSVLPENIFLHNEIARKKLSAVRAAVLSLDKVCKSIFGSQWLTKIDKTTGRSLQVSDHKNGGDLVILGCVIMTYEYYPSLAGASLLNRPSDGSWTHVILTDIQNWTNELVKIQKNNVQEANT